MRNVLVPLFVEWIPLLPYQSVLSSVLFSVYNFIFNKKYTFLQGNYTSFSLFFKVFSTQLTTTFINYSETFHLLLCKIEKFGTT